MNIKYREEEYMNKDFGRLHVDGPIEYVIDRRGHKQKRVWCTCKCGGRKLVHICQLFSGDVSSCGCAQEEQKIKLGQGRHNGTIYSKGHTTHGGHGTRLHNIWSNMRGRCKYECCDAYKWYGGRGIKVCEEWDNPVTGFINFRDWAFTNGYDDTKEIDRIDNDDHYYPGNCRWRTRIEQNNHSSHNVNLTYGDRTYTLSQWARMIDMCASTLDRRYNDGWSTQEILTIPNLGCAETKEGYKQKHGIKPFIFIDESKKNQI